MPLLWEMICFKLINISNDMKAFQFYTLLFIQVQDILFFLFQGRDINSGKIAWSVGKGLALQA